MKSVELSIYTLFIFIVFTSHNIFAKPLYAWRTKTSTIPSIDPNMAAYTHLTKYGYNTCENQARQYNKLHGISVSCQISLKAMLEDFQARHKLPITGMVDKKIKKLMETPRCAIKDKPYPYRFRQPWSKTSFTWTLNDKNLPAFGENKTRELIQQSFEDWAMHSILTFKEVSGDAIPDIIIAFTPKENNKYFTGVDRILSYVKFPNLTSIHFNAKEPWTDKYDDNGVNLRLVATHAIGHFLGLGHSYDLFSIMYPYYRFPRENHVLSKVDRDDIQALYKVKPTTNKTQNNSIMQDENGGQYEGQLKDKKKHGYGTYTWKNGDKYIGYWENDERTGNGLYLWHNGDKYEGEFKNNMRHGRGMYTWANGAKYVGNFIEHNMVNEDTHTLVGGDQLEQPFEDGKNKELDKILHSDKVIEDSVEPISLFSDH